MSKAAPSWPEDFSCLEKDLSVVPVVLELRKVKEELKSQKRKLNVIRYEHLGTGEALFKRINTNLTAITADGDMTPEEYQKRRRTRMKAAVEDIRRAAKEGNPAVYGAYEADCTHIIYSLYANFDQEAFDNDYLDLYVDELEDKTAYNQWTTCLAAIGRAEKKIAEIKNRLLKTFDVVPDDWEGVTFPTKQEMAEYIAERFVSLWESRALRFAKPVTVSGIQISSMPESYRITWQVAYDKLGLNDQKKSDYYYPLKYANVTGGV